MRIHLPKPDSATELARLLACTIEPPLLVFLNGPLGAGKTHLVRAVLVAMGHQGAVKSPTYTLIERYRIGDRAICHLDLYRIADPGELEFLDLREAIASEIVFIEWADRGRGYLPPADLEIDLDYAGEGRSLAMRATGPRGAALIQRVSSLLASGEMVVEPSGPAASPCERTG